MAESSMKADFTGARGSNAGDQFHELWALRKVLELLQPQTDLKAVGVEGVRIDAPSQGDQTFSWDGVDCTLYYGGTTLESADRVAIIQLKYSSANPDKTWSVSRLRENTAKTKNNSVIRKLAEAYKHAMAIMKPGATLKIFFVSNQNISEELHKILKAYYAKVKDNTDFEPQTTEVLNQIAESTGLSPTEFNDFLNVLDFGECGSDSRFALRENVVAAIVEILGNDVLSEMRELQYRIRELMLPERTGEVVTEKDILLWLGVSSREALLPCPPDIRIPAKTVERAAVKDVINLIDNNKRMVLVHGTGGCGKTTLMHQVANLLPQDSVVILFDCFGGGRYIYTDDKRHLPENAFLHLINNIALSLNLPLFVPRNTKQPANIGLFLDKLQIAGGILEKKSANALLMIIIDAADNSIIAAGNTNPPEKSFISDILGSNMASIPKNVRFIVSCRTARRSSLFLPNNIPEVVCPPFEIHETRAHLKTFFPDIKESFVEQFHVLTNKNPRVQAYTIVSANSDLSRLLETLLPSGKSLTDVLKLTFDNALTKLGQHNLFDKLVGVLAFLPAPISIAAVSRIAGCSEDIICDFALDLSPGFRLQGNAITIADEDFEEFIRNEGNKNKDIIIAEIANDFTLNFLTDPYSSIHVADALLEAGRAREILSIIEQDPQAKALSDPIVRQHTQARRLKLSLAACKDAGSKVDSLKTILISAEAERDESTLNNILEKELDLSVDFGGPSLRRRILLDRDRIEDQGSFLAHDAVRAIRSGDHFTAKEQLYFHQAWLKRRNSVKKNDRSRWPVTEGDIAARVETILKISGPEEALNELLSWRPREILFKVAFALIPQLIAADQTDLLDSILKECNPPSPWDLLLRVPLAMSGKPVNGTEIIKSLKRIRKRFVPNIFTITLSSGNDNWQQKLLDIFVTACELSYAQNMDAQVIKNVISQILEILEGNPKKYFYSTDAYRLDAICRCWLLKKEIEGLDANINPFINYLNTLHPVPASEAPNAKRRKKKLKQDDKRSNRQEEQFIKKVQALFPIYSARSTILLSARKNLQITNEQINKLAYISEHSYDFDYDHDSIYFRDTAAHSVMNLLIIKEMPADELLKQASILIKGRYSDAFVKHQQKLWAQMLFRVSESKHIVQLAADAAEHIKHLHASSSEKIDAIIKLSRLIYPVSHDDARALFIDAMGIAKEIDQEAIDQIGSLSALAERADFPDKINNREIAKDIYAFIAGAAEHLWSNNDFPWKSAIHALTCVDENVALAGICRWADEGSVEVNITLHQFLLTALKRNAIDVETATSLATFFSDIENELRLELATQAAKDSEKHKTVIEELSRAILLFEPQHRRRSFGQQIIEQFAKNPKLSGPWFTQLRTMVDFLNENYVNTPIQNVVSHYSPIQHNNIDQGVSKEFEFDPQGKPFVTSQQIDAILKVAKISDQTYSEYDLLKKMRDASSNPKDKVPFLNALVSVANDCIRDTTRLDVIIETLSLWKGIPAVNLWCKESLPSAIIMYFQGATLWLKEESSVLRKLLEYTGLNIEKQIEIILTGIARSSGELSSSTLFAIGEEIVRSIDATDANTLLIWYSQRLKNRIPFEDITKYFYEEIPKSITASIARFLFAMMSDIDTRIRWKAAHVLRVFARMGCIEIVNTTIAESDRTNERAFRDPTAPFYFISARLWLLISLYRISAETPNALASSKNVILKHANSPLFPHIAIREYAKRILLQLAAEGVITLNEAEKKVIDQINNPVRSNVSKDTASYRSFDNTDTSQRRYSFDYMDTLRYWYVDILRIFPLVPQNKVLDIAETWIVDEWGADTDAIRWDKEPRKSRLNERQYGLWSHSHGSFPIIERYGTYLEWNAMNCVIGELLSKKYTISNKNDDYDSFEYWVNRILPSEPPYWLSDNKGPTPLENRFWFEDPRTDLGWLNNLRRSEVLCEIGIGPSEREGWIIIEGRYETRFRKRETDVDISTALVSDDRASALVRALQTATDPYDFRIPTDENDDLQITEPHYSFLGWLSGNQHDLRFDDYDPFRYDVRQIHSKPGRSLIKTFRLIPDGLNKWIVDKKNETAFIYEAWCDEPSQDEDADYSGNTCSKGWRLWANAEIIKKYLNNGSWHLICGVQINRKLHNEYGRRYESSAKSKRHERILLLQKDGSISDIKGHLGSWTGDCKGT